MRQMMVTVFQWLNYQKKGSTAGRAGSVSGGGKQNNRHKITVV